MSPDHPGKTFGDTGNHFVTAAHYDDRERIAVTAWMKDPQRAVLTSLSAVDARELGELLIHLAGEASS